MLRDLSKFETFLSSLSRVSGLRLEIRDREGRLLLPSAPACADREPAGLEALSARVVEAGRYQGTSIRGSGSASGVPIRCGDRVVGALIATGREVEPEGMEAFLEHTVGLMTENISCHQEVEDITEELSRSFEDLHLYARIGTQIKTLKFSDAMLKALMEEIMDSMRADLAFAELPERRIHNVRVAKPHMSDRITDPDGLVDMLVASIPADAPSLQENYFILNHSEEQAAFRRLYPEPYRFLAVKVVHDAQEYGWLGLFSVNLRKIFRQSELRLLTSMAEQVAAIIANTDLYHDLERFVVNMVKSLVHAIEAKDVYTRGHSERVNLYCMMIAEQLGLAEPERETLHWASILHDIGKIGIPEQILNKPGRLTEGEFQSIQDHPTKGYNILAPIEQLSGALPGILHHHERYDGKGYPHGLKAEEIPLAARIIAVADTFDAITSTRAYRPEKSFQEALEIIQEVSGSQLDPELVKLFTRLVVEDMDTDRERMLHRTGTMG